MFDKVNLENELSKIRERQNQRLANAALFEFKALFQADWERDQRISQTLKTGAVSENLPNPHLLNQKRIFEIQDIKALCLKYRLRFLSSKQFKPDFPQEAVFAVKATEDIVGQNLDAFMMVAPAAMFRLEDADKDPLLFAPLSDGSFYLVHKWGKDLSWHRALLAWPFKNPARLATTILTLAFLFCAVVPTSMLSDTGTYFNFYRTAFFAWNVIFISAMTSYFWFALYQKFSVEAWNSPHFN